MLRLVIVPPSLHPHARRAAYSRTFRDNNRRGCSTSLQAMYDAMIYKIALASDVRATRRGDRDE